MTPGWRSGIKTGTSSDLDLIKIGQARNKIMDIKLNQASCDIGYFQNQAPTDDVVYLRQNI